jgi:hypothetical protein
MEYLNKINYITSYKKNDEKTENVVRLDLNKIKYQWTTDTHFHFIYDDLIISRINNYQVNYNCLTCNREIIVSLNNLTKKIEKKSMNCFNCMYNNSSLVDKIEMDESYFFNNLCEKNRVNFQKKMVHPKHFEKIRDNIRAYNNGKYENMSDIIYVPYYRPTQSDKYYESCFYDKNRDVVLRAINITLECCHCKHCFLIDNLKPYRKTTKIYCSMCSNIFSNAKYKYECNIIGENVAYKTKMQHKFIKYCNNNGIVCKNGRRNISLNGINGNVSVDFIVDKYLIDVVGNKEFQVPESKKTIELKLYANTMNYEYVIIYPKNYVRYTRCFKQLPIHRE